jgi:hypothetical protein
MFQTTSIRASAAKDNKLVGLPFNLDAGFVFPCRHGGGSILHDEPRRQRGVLPLRKFYPSSLFSIGMTQTSSVTFYMKVFVNEFPKLYKQFIAYSTM